MDWNWIYAYQLRLRNHRRTVDKGTFRFKVHPWICCDRTQQCWWMCRTSPRFDQRSSVHFNECWIFRSAQTSQALFVFFLHSDVQLLFGIVWLLDLNLLQHLFFFVDFHPKCRSWRKKSGSVHQRVWNTSSWPMMTLFLGRTWKLWTCGKTSKFFIIFHHDSIYTIFLFFF